MADVAVTDDAERIARLRLIRTGGIGPVTYAHLIARFGTAAQALEAVPLLAARGGGRAPQLLPEAIAVRELATVEAFGGRHIFIGDADYPEPLAMVDDAPPVLTVIGDTSLFARPVVAMVGARNASAAACRFARQLAHDLAGQGFVVASGLARGVDTAAHMGALGGTPLADLGGGGGRGGGGTIAVIAGGIDVVYPPENADLQRRIAAEALLVAEMPPGTEPRARHFPHRNRIIAGIAAGTVVVEAAPKSGSLITARLAGEQGREVMAVPGSPLDPRAQGCNQLIREGATLVQSAADIIEAIRPIDPRMLRAPASHFGAAAPVDASDGERADVLALLGPVPVAVDELIRQSGLAPAAVQTVLLELELAGRLDRHAAGRVSLA